MGSALVEDTECLDKAERLVKLDEFGHGAIPDSKGATDWATVSENRCTASKTETARDTVLRPDAVCHRTEEFS